MESFQDPQPIVGYGISKSTGTMDLSCNHRPYDRAAHVTIDQSFLLRAQQRDFFSSIVTGDELCVRYENTTRKATALPPLVEKGVQEKTTAPCEKCSQTLMPTYAYYILQ